MVLLRTPCAAVPTSQLADNVRGERGRERERGERVRERQRERSFVTALKCQQGCDEVRPEA